MLSLQRIDWEEDLEKKYGKVNVSIEAGTITPMKEEKEDEQANT